MSKVKMCNFCGETPHDKDRDGMPEVRDSWIMFKCDETMCDRIDVCPDCRKSEPVYELVVREEVIKENRGDNDEVRRDE